ncbi:Acyl-coenzyme A:6-aminopenicillanic acid acyl-transferase [Planctomycetes bacterium Pan216]|uniref:Acyl-coenzyme A:6-aminopenicillanic acid acyl-transferase n=1 Tax=Kolteria novifilia TaxID=2527975 RepID=A0A518BD06_9BACT|nr:Acyl-coenzyme A:6-aminopenicillanic acid acyl-transferase [Planctomycetes bacterium Pan216]
MPKWTSSPNRSTLLALAILVGGLPSLVALRADELVVARPKREIVARCGEGYLELVDGYRVLHLKGSPYEMGYQHGVLLKDECRELLHHLTQVKAKEVSLEFMGMTVSPVQIIQMIFALQRPYVPPRYVEELEGLAAGADLPLQQAFVANSIPELFHCSGFALRSDLTESGSMLHGRVLDYGIDWRLQEFAVLVLAEPEGKIPFANITYTGFIGSVGGMNTQQVSIGEMGGRGAGKWAGTPMAFLVRRVLEEADSLDEAIEIFRDSRRTCEYYYVIADAEADDAVGLDGSADRFEVIKMGASHPRLPTPVPGTVLLSAGDRYGHLCRLVSDVRDTKEKFSFERARRLMDAPVAMKSNLHNVLFAPGLGKLWVANAGPNGEPAWQRKYYGFDINELLTTEPEGDAQVFELPSKEK